MINTCNTFTKKYFPTDINGKHPHITCFSLAPKLILKILVFLFQMQDMNLVVFIWKKMILVSLEGTKALFQSLHLIRVIRNIKHAYFKLGFIVTSGKPAHPFPADFSYSKNIDTFELIYIKWKWVMINADNSTTDLVPQLKTTLNKQASK